MANPHFRITVDYGRGASPRHFDYSSAEGFDALREAIDQAGKALDDSLSPVAVTICNLGKIADRAALDRAAVEVCPDCGTPEAIVDEINASLSRRT